MEDQESIRINLQLPASALDSLSRLTEQLRLLTSALSSRPEFSPQQAWEQEESTFFDPEQFQVLRTKVEAPEGSDTPVSGEQAAMPVRSRITKQVRTPESAGREAVQPEEKPVSETLSPEEDIPGAEAAAADISPEHAIQPAPKTPVSAEEPAQAAHPAMEEIPDPPAVQPEPDGHLQKPDRAEGEVTPWNALPSPVRTEIQSGTASPLGAGVVVTAEPGTPQSRWTGITEELVTPGPAPLTAESVSLAFQRDGRRYDNGFPLY